MNSRGSRLKVFELNSPVLDGPVSNNMTLVVSSIEKHHISKGHFVDDSVKNSSITDVACLFKQSNLMAFALVDQGHPIRRVNSL